MAPSLLWGITTVDVLIFVSRFEDWTARLVDLVVGFRHIGCFRHLVKPIPFTNLRCHGNEFSLSLGKTPPFLSTQKHLVMPLDHWYPLILGINSSSTHGKDAANLDHPAQQTLILRWNWCPKSHSGSGMGTQRRQSCDAKEMQAHRRRWCFAVARRHVGDLWRFCVCWPLTGPAFFFPWVKAFLKKRPWMNHNETSVQTNFPKVSSISAMDLTAKLPFCAWTCPNCGVQWVLPIVHCWDS